MEVDKSRIVLVEKSINEMRTVLFGVRSSYAALCQVHVVSVEAISVCYHGYRARHTEVDKTLYNFNSAPSKEKIHEVTLFKGEGTFYHRANGIMSEL